MSILAIVIIFAVVLFVPMSLVGLIEPKEREA